MIIYEIRMTATGHVYATPVAHSATDEDDWFYDNAWRLHSKAQLTARFVGKLAYEIVERS